MKEYILVTVSGPDYPGITARLMKVLENSEFQLADIGQNVTHGLLSLSFLLSSGDKRDQNQHSTVLKDLLFEAKRLGVNLDFQLIESNPSQRQGQGERYIVSCVSNRPISAGFLGHLAQSLAGKDVNILRLDNMTAPDDFKCLEITVENIGINNLIALKLELIEVGSKFEVDTALIKENLYRGNKRLIVFDMDSTFIQAEVIDELAAECNIKEEVAAITERAMNGELDYTAALKQRVGLLKGLKVEALAKVLNRLPITPGVPEFLEVVKKNGYKTAIISGGFSYFAQALKERYALDYAFANQLEVCNGELTGQVVGPIVDGQQKAILLQLIAQQESITLDQVVAIGDGANDLPMLSKAGLGIAFHAKDLVKKQAKHQMSYGPMTSILYFLGLKGPRA